MENSLNRTNDFSAVWSSEKLPDGSIEIKFTKEGFWAGMTWGLLKATWWIGWPIVVLFIAAFFMSVGKSHSSDDTVMWVALGLAVAYIVLWFSIVQKKGITAIGLIKVIPGVGVEIEGHSIPRDDVKNITVSFRDIVYKKNEKMVILASPRNYRNLNSDQAAKEIDLYIGRVI